MLKSGGTRIIEWLLRMFNKCMESGVVPEELETAYIVPVYKGKGSILGNRFCPSFEGVSRRESRE